MLPSGSWGKRKPQGRRLGWVRSDARGTMWARQEGLRHSHPHAVVRCPSSSSSSVSCSGKGLPGCPCSLGPWSHYHFLFLPSFPTAPTSCCPWLPPWGFRAMSGRGPISLCLCLLWGLGRQGQPARPLCPAWPPPFLSACAPGPPCPRLRPAPTRARVALRTPAELSPFAWLYSFLKGENTKPNSSFF